MAQKTPLLWQIKLSHYNEKARWALDYKQVPHRRRAPMPLFGTLPIALFLTGGTTFPVLQIDGESIGDSTRIIAELERRYPDPPLYPDDPAERQRALEIEDYFDEQVAPAIRLLFWFEIMKDTKLFQQVAVPDAPAPFAAVLRATAPVATRIVGGRYGINEQTAAEARQIAMAGIERLQSEIGPSGYLAGDSFSVADLTAAAMFTPLVSPPGRPYLPTVKLPPALADFAAELSGTEGGSWIFEIYDRHRDSSASADSEPAAAAR